MTYTSLATPVPNTKILVSAFGALTKQNFDDHEGRIAAINANLGTPWSGSSALTRLLFLESAATIRHERTTAAQSIATGVDVVLTFPVTVRSNTLYFTESGGSYTCVKTGYVDAMGSLRMASATTGLELKFKLNGNRVAGGGFGSTLQGSVATGFPVTAGDVITLVALHTTGSAKNTETGAERQNHIALSYRGL